MALLHPTRDGDAGGAFGALTPAERIRDGIKRARRHTRRVKSLRILLPLATVGLFGSYAFVVMQKTGALSDLPQVALQKILPENLKMDNPHYDGFGKDGSSYVLDAKSAQQDFSKPDLILLDAISATLIQPDKSKTHITATSGTFNNKQNQLELHEAIDVKAESGMSAKLTQATIQTKTGVLTSNEPVTVDYPTGSIRAKTLLVRQKEKEAEFVGEVVANLKPKPQTSEPQAAAPSADAPAGFFKTSDAPIDITSERLAIKDKEQSAVFIGGVKAVQGEGALLSPELAVIYERSSDSAAGAEAQKPAVAGDTMANSKVKRILAKGPVVMTQGADQRIDAGSAEFDAQNETAVFLSNVVMTAAEDRRITSDRADLDQRADTALLTGDVVLEQGKTILKGRRFFVDRKAGTAHLTSPPGGGDGPGRITAHLEQEPPKGAKPAKPKPAKEEKAAAGPGFGTFKTDPGAPIDVESDALAVADAKHTVTFTGDVKAVQGDFVIRAAELVASYTGDASITGVTNVGKAAVGGKEKSIQTELARIDMKKDVVVTSDDGQSARGDWAIYDAKTSKVTLGGEVALSNGGNLVRGTRLVIDMVSGQSTIDTDPASPAAQGAPNTGWSATSEQAAGETKRGRPSAILFPKSLKGAEKAGAGKKTGAAASPWSAKTGADDAAPDN